MERGRRPGVKIVVKVGGAAIEEKSTLHKCAHAIVELARDGHHIAVVHGGGVALTRTLKLLGKESDFVNGLRITDAETRDVALMVLAGIVNKTLVAGINAAGYPAIGLCGGDGTLFRARKKLTPGYDLGYVGEISSVEPKWLEAIWGQGGVPVLSSLALGSDGEYYNINADQMASACAVATHADALIFLTDVAGVKDAQGTVIPWLTTKEITALIADSVVAGGMLPKLEACSQALKRGVGRVRILPSAQVDMLPQFYFSKLEYGTEVIGA
jgi:acetylglutamate kinase